MAKVRRTLDPAQEEAVERRREPLHLAAGAGSGKTSVLVERFVRAVSEDGISPGRILAITFTERAAAELKERVRERLKELGERSPRLESSARDTEAAFVSTFHGFCARLLRGHPLAVGLDPEFEILDEGLAGRMRERAFKHALADFLASEREEAVDLLAAYGPDRTRAMVGGVYAELRSRGMRTPVLPDPGLGARGNADDLDGAGACALLGELLAGFGEAYEALKGERGAVDFDDLELLARELLEEHESVRVAWSERFELLMVDEFQDTNPRQLAILTALERGNLFTVGDELQSIYGFRHADVTLFRARRAELSERDQSLELARNFRSRAPLLDVVNTVFAERFGTGYTPLLAGREGGGAQGREDIREGAGEDGGKAGGDPLVELLLTDTGGWEEDGATARAIAGERLPVAPRWRQAEARLLAQRVAELVDGGGAHGGEVVVLLRAVGDLPVYERALQECGLRTLATVGDFWRRQEVGDLLSYLRALANPLDELALYGTLASPLVGCSSDGLALLARVARARGRGRVWEVLGGGEDLDGRLSAADRDALSRFGALLEGERRAAPSRTISQLIERAITAGGYREHVLGLDGGERRLANVHKLLRLARRFEASEGRDLRGFLDHVAHLADSTSGSEADAPVAGVEPDAVRLMTIHAAKGLEFPVVCVADLGREQNVSVPDLLVAGDRVGLRLMRLDGAKATPTLAFEELCQERQRAQVEEEERILYVAMTRARERLLLSGAVNFARWPEERLRAPTISWLGPALAPELPALAQALERPVLDLIVGGTPVRCRLNARGTLGTVLHGRAPHASADARRLEGDDGQQRLPFSTESPPRRGLGESVSGRSGAPVAFGGGDSLSYTTLSELERCGYRYYLERALGLGEDRSGTAERPSRGGLGARARGTLVHRLLESVDFTRATAPSPRALSRLARELGMRVGARESEEIADLVGAVTAGASSGSGPAGRVAGARSVHREHPFAFSVGPGEPLLTGVIDLLAREGDGGCLLIDYKSDRVGAQDDLGRLVEREYGVQRLIYALAVLRDGAPRVEVVHWFLERPEDWVGAAYAASDRGELEERLAARIQRARARMFAVSEHPHRGLCETCPGRAGLCSWSDGETMRELPGDEASGSRPRGEGLPEV